MFLGAEGFGDGMVLFLRNMEMLILNNCFCTGFAKNIAPQEEEKKKVDCCFKNSVLTMIVITILFFLSRNFTSITLFVFDMITDVID